MFNNILIVCTANICRSPAVEAFLKAKIGDNKVITSAGISAKDNNKPDPFMAELLLDRGINISNNTSKRVTKEMLSKADLVLVMEKKHAKELAEIHSSVLGKVKLLGHWDGSREVPDPYKKDFEAYRFVVKLIEDFTQSWHKVLAK